MDNLTIEKLRSMAFEASDEDQSNFLHSVADALLTAQPQASDEIPFAGFDPNFCPGSNPENPQTEEDEPEQPSAAQSAPAGERETIRAVFLRNGFTVKEGQTDLKPYVYAAAEELLSIARASWQHTQSAPVSKAERLPLESLEPLHRPVPSGWAVKRPAIDARYVDNYLGPLDGWLQDPRRAVLFGNKEAAIAVQAALSVDSKLPISVVWLVYDPVFDTYREQSQ